MKWETDSNMGKNGLSVLTCVVSFTLLSLLNVPQITAQDFTVGFVDPRLIMDRMPEAKAVQQRIQNLYEKKQNELVVKQQDLQTEIELYQQKAGVISKEVRQTEEERLTQMDLEFRQLQSEARQELQERSAELMAPLFEQIQTSVNEVAAQQELDLILNLTMGGYGVLDRNILYVSPELQTEYNITSAVIENLDL